jgi:hypothetical protein
MSDSEDVERAASLSQEQSQEIQQIQEAPKSKEEGPAIWETLVEIVEVVALAFVAIATAWGGYQAAKWDGRQSVLYGTANTYRFQAEAASTAGGQVLVADSAMFTAWLQATAAHQTKLADVYVRRFSPEYRSAFYAWQKTSPLTNPNAPAGPADMPQYHNPRFAQATQLNNLAAATFALGSAARDNSDNYVRVTVLFAAVLFLVAIAQRFTIRNVRVATTTIAIALLVFAVVLAAGLPKAA